MDKKKLNILLVDDDSLHLEILSTKLKKLGYSNLVLTNSFDEACDHLDSCSPDIILLDYYLDSGKTGKQIIKECLVHRNIPLFFISTFYGPEVFDEIKELPLMEFLPKNVNEFDLDKAIDIAMRKKEKLDNNSRLKEFMFVRNGKDIKKIRVSDICFITVDGKYLELHSSDRRFLIRSTLSEFEKRLPDYFMKIHKAYIININHLDSVSVDMGQVKVCEKIIPLSRNFKKDLLSMYYVT